MRSASGSKPVTVLVASRIVPGVIVIVVIVVVSSGSASERRVDEFTKTA
jgi:hypothetical protein